MAGERVEGILTRDLREPPAVERGARGLRNGAGLLALAGIVLVLAAALNLGVAWLPAHASDTRFSLNAVSAPRGVALGYSAALIASFAAYLLAWRQARRITLSRRSLALVLGVPAAAAVLLTPTYPLLSRDFFYTVIEGRITGHYRANPFALAPDQFPGDRFLPYADWHAVTMPYGPLWTLVIGAVGRVAGDDPMTVFLLYKLLFLTAFLVATAFLTMLLDRLDRRELLPGMVLWGWNPLVLLELVANAHNDVVMLVFVLLAAFLARRRSVNGAIVALTMAFAIKSVAFGLLPILLLYATAGTPSWRERARRVAPGLAVSSALLAGLYVIFWVDLWHTVLRFAGQAGYYIASPVALARTLLRHWLVEPGPALALFALALAGLFYVWLLRAPRADFGWLRDRWFAALLVGLVAWPVFYPWYVPWLVAVAATGLARRLQYAAILLSATAAASYLYQYGLRQLVPHSPVFWSSAVTVTVFGALLSAAIPSYLVPALRSWRQRSAQGPVRPGASSR